MECPICFDEVEHVYQLKGCTHSVCVKCSDALKHQPESVHYAFSAVFVIESAPQIQLKCPLCRAKEPVKSAEELKDDYPDEYLEWMENELHRDEWGNTFSYVYVDITKPVYKKPMKLPKLVNNRRSFKPWQKRKL
jgi:hypothetical protein